MNVRLHIVLPFLLEGCSLDEEEDVVMTDVFVWCSGERVLLAAYLQQGTRIATRGAAMLKHDVVANSFMRRPAWSTLISERTYQTYQP